MVKETKPFLNLHKYSRQISLPFIGIKGLETIKKSKIMLVGAGALAHNCCQYLASSGIGEIIIFDQDIIEESNLPRQILFTKKDLGKKKVEVLSNYIKNHYPETKIKVYDCFFTNQNNINFPKNIDLIINASDNFTTRKKINEFSIQHSISWIDMGVLAMNGHVALFQPGQGCFSCLFPNIESSEVNCSLFGVLPSVCGLIGSFVVNETIKFLTCLNQNKVNTYYQFNFKENNFKKFFWVKDQSCFTCKDLIKTEQKNTNRENLYLISYDEFKNQSSLNSVKINFNIRQEKHEQYDLDFNISEKLFQSILNSNIKLIKSILNEQKINFESTFYFFCNYGIKSKIACEFFRKNGFNAFYSKKI